MLPINEAMCLIALSCILHIYMRVCVCVLSQKILWSVTLLPAVKIYNNISLVKDFCQLPECHHCRDSAGWMLRGVGEAVCMKAQPTWAYTGTIPSRAPHWGGWDLRVLPFSFCFGPVLLFFFFLLFSPLNSGHSCRYLSPKLSHHLLP